MQKKFKWDNSKREILAYVLATAGFVSLLLAAGTEDYRYSGQYDPKTEQLASQKTTTGMTLGGMTALLGATALLIARNKHESR